VEAVRAFDAALESGTLASAQLDAILRCTGIRSTLISECASGLLGELAAQFPAARGALTAMCSAPKFHVRVNALVALHSVPSFELREVVLRTALSDRSARVRTLAADLVMNFGL
jgi:hypothetical protein